MSGSVAVIISAAVMLYGGAVCQTEHSQYYKTSAVVSSEAVRFNVPVRSLVDCAALCSRDMSCIRFTLSLAATGQMCQGHDLLVDDSGSGGGEWSGQRQTYTLSNPAGKTDECIFPSCPPGTQCVDGIKSFTCE